ncbi:serine hydrolase domain-containing protein [Thermomonas sp.]|uniref:serine hydrolase domain-containing protein n=1 Tax=Thermomonas sp. TaxID=1971895 RepID=UPI0024880272|nr:serine hydrolase domain-containing protein [Thermomonas sp.]MDI1253158.1 serine hydrolase [Thermomonas sp.]
MRIPLFLFLLVLCATARTAEPSDFVGLWGNETVSGPLLPGVLTVDGRQAPWRASVAGVSVVIERDGDVVTFSMPGGQGHFRGRLIGGNIEGFWIQPPGQGLASAYATPLVLPHGEGEIWVARLDPLQDRITQYLQIQRTGESSLKAFLVNPEYNLGRGISYDVHLDGDAIVLTDPNRKGWALNGRLDDESGQLRIDWQGIGVFPFTRRDRDDAIGYYANTPAGSQDVYRVPVPAGDGWTTASLGEVGMQVAPMQRMQQQIESSDTPGPGEPMVHGLLVARHGKLVFETYLHGYSREQAHDTRSAGKSFASLLVGMAVEHGADLSAKTPVQSMFPTNMPLEHMDKDKRAITVSDLMDMSSGLACDDNDSDSPGGEEAMQRQHAERDWYRYTLNLPMVQAPGADKAVYCSAGINLLGGVVRNATGRRLTDLFQDWIAGPMQMRGYHMNLMPDDDAYLAGGIRMRPRDMLKLGQLYLNGGIWNGQRLVAQRWIDASVARHATFGPNHDYGFAWHLHAFRVDGHDYRSYSAEGNGGQFVIVVPELDLVVAITAGNYGQFSVWYPLQELVSKYVIPAALQGNVTGDTPAQTGR